MDLLKCIYFNCNRKIDDDEKSKKLQELLDSLPTKFYSNAFTELNKNKDLYEVFKSQTQDKIASFEDKFLEINNYFEQFEVFRKFVENNSGSIKCTSINLENIGQTVEDNKGKNEADSNKVDFYQNYGLLLLKFCKYHNYVFLDKEEEKEDKTDDEDNDDDNENSRVVFLLDKFKQEEEEPEEKEEEEEGKKDENQISEPKKDNNQNQKIEKLLNNKQFHSVIDSKEYNNLIQKELKYFALFGIEVFVATLTYYHVGVYLLFFLVPVLSLLFCEKKIYLISSGFAYVCAFILIVYNADYNISKIKPVVTKGLYLRKTLGFFSLEFFIMCVAGFIIVTVMTNYLRSLFEDMQKVTGVEIDVEADPLTGLWPKPYLEKCYEKYVLEQKHQSALVILELDNLKELNEEYDEYTGDRALCAFADVLRETFRVSDLSVICRVGGPKFAVLVPLLEDESDLEPCLARLQRNVYYRMSQTKEFKNLTASIGASFGIQDGADFYTVYNKAESALHIVKMAGKNDYHIYQPGDTLIFSRK